MVRGANGGAEGELGAMARGWLFWIVGGLVTGTGLIALGSFLLYHQLHPELDQETWISNLRSLWGAPLGFGAVVVIHALDVVRNRRTILRILRRGVGEDGSRGRSGGAGW